jgi:hypothetical protein
VALALPHGAAASDAGGTVRPEPLVGDRPDFTESAVVVPRGSVQVELGLTSAHLDGARQESFGELLCRIGVASGFELRLEPGSYLRERDGGSAEQGREDGAVGCKIELAPAGGWRPETAIIAGTTLPTGVRALRNDHLQPDLLLAWGWDLGPTLALGANAGCGWRHDGDASFTEGRASVSLGAALAPRVGAFLETFAWTAAPGEELDPMYCDLGITALIAPQLQIDMRFGAGLNGRDPDHFWGVGLVARR